MDSFKKLLFDLRGTALTSKNGKRVAAVLSVNLQKETLLLGGDSRPITLDEALYTYDVINAKKITK